MSKFNIINAGQARSSTTIKGLIYGDSGSGKSFLAATAPRPLVLLTEKNGQASISHSNPALYNALLSAALTSTAVFLSSLLDVA